MRNKYGDVGRNTLRQPGMKIWDIGLFKEFPVARGSGSSSGGKRSTCGTHRSSALPNSQLGAPNFGQITSTWLDNRQMQFASKVLLKHSEEPMNKRLLLVVLAACMPLRAVNYTILLKGGHVIDPRMDQCGRWTSPLRTARSRRVAGDIPAPNARKTGERLRADASRPA